MALSDAQGWTITKTDISRQGLIMADTALQTPPINIDGRTKNGKPLDLKQVFKLRAEGKTNADISKLLGYSQPYIGKVIKQFKKILKHPDVLDTYNNNRTQVLNSIELTLLDNMVQEDKLQKASLNNVAYAMTQTSNLRRLESGESTVNVGIAIEHKLAKALEKAHGTTNTIDTDAIE